MRSATMAFLACIMLSAGVLATAADVPRPANFPSKPVEIIVPYAPGGGLDRSSRLVGRFAEKELGQHIEVVNRTKGGNIQGNLEAIGAPPDGYVIGAWGNNLVTDQLLVKGVPYTHKSVRPLCMFSVDPNVVVVAKSFASEKKITTLEDLFDYARANPGKVTIGMGGNWSTHDFLRLKMEEMAGVKFNRMPFLGGAPALKATAAGNCDVAVPYLPEILAALKEGQQVVPLAIAHPSRAKQLPDVPTTAEAGHPDMIQSIWRCFTLPLETPDEIVDYLERVFDATLRDPDFQAAAVEAGITPVFKSGRELSDFLEKEYDYYAKKTQEWGVRVN